MQNEFQTTDNSAFNRAKQSRVSSEPVDTDGPMNSPPCLDRHQSAEHDWIIAESNAPSRGHETRTYPKFYVTIVNATGIALRVNLPFANMPTEVKAWGSTSFWRYGNVGQVYTLKFTLGSLVHTAALGHTSDGVNWARWNTNEPNRFKRWKSYYPEKDGPLTVTFVVAR